MKMDEGDDAVSGQSPYLMDDIEDDEIDSELSNEENEVSDVDGDIGRFSENDAIDSENSKPINNEFDDEGDENGFEELIGYTQEDEDQLDK
jgi:hypothetical protein